MYGRSCKMQDPETSLSSSNASNANVSQSSAIVVTSGPEIVSSLHIKTVRPKDAGIYTCAPSNARNYTVVVHVIKGMHCLEYFTHYKKDHLLSK